MVAPESCPAPGRTADSTWRTARPPSWLSRAPARRARRGASLGEGAFPGRTLTPVGGAGASPRGSGWVLGSRRGHPRAVGPPAPSRPAPARPVRPAPRPPSAPPLPAAGGPSASLSRAAERTGAGHAADGGEGAGPGKGTRGPGTPHPWRPLIPTPGAGPRTLSPGQPDPSVSPRLPASGPGPPAQGRGSSEGWRGGGRRHSERLGPGAFPHATPSSRTGSGVLAAPRTCPARVKQSPGRPGLAPAAEGSPARDRPPRRPEPRSRAQAPLQDWGEETEDGAVYSVSLRRQRSQRLSPREGPGDGQVGRDWRAGRGGGPGRAARSGARAGPDGRAGVPGRGVGE